MIPGRAGQRTDSRQRGATPKVRTNIGCNTNGRNSATQMSRSPATRERFSRLNRDPQSRSGASGVPPLASHTYFYGAARRSRDTASAEKEPLNVPHVLTSHAMTTGAKVRRSDARRRGTRTGHHLGRYSLRRHRRADEGPRDLGTDVDVPEVGLVIDSRGRILDQVRLVGLRDCHRQVLLRGSHRGDDRAIELDQSSLRGGRTSRAATRDACFG